MKHNLKYLTSVLTKWSVKFRLGYLALSTGALYFILAKSRFSFWSSLIFIIAVLLYFYLLNFWFTNQKRSVSLFRQFLVVLIILSLLIFLIYFLFADNERSFFANNTFLFFKFFIGGFLFCIFITTLIFANSANTLHTDKKLKEQNEKIILENEALRIDFLKAQMNTHFVFNCLVNITDTLRLGQINQAIEYNNSVSKLLRYQLENADKKMISLAEELQWLKQYIGVEMHRHPGLFDYTIECNGINTYELFIPPMMLQPFVENSIRHAFIPAGGETKGILTIRILQTASDTYYVEIEDTGKQYKLDLEKKLKPNDKSIAIKNIRERIKLLKFTSPFSITLHTQLNDVGFRVKLGVAQQL